MFKRDRPNEPPEVSALRRALNNKHKNTKISVESEEGATWTFYADKLRGCKLVITEIQVYETHERGEDVHVEFKVTAMNGRIGQ